jgi:hypothetical protein
LGGIQGFDRYAYVKNNPIINIDPSGHLCQDVSASGHTISVCVPDLGIPNTEGATSLGDPYPNNLHKWQARGLNIGGEGWTTERLNQVLNSFDMSERTIGNYQLTQRDLGLDQPGGLMVLGSNNTSYCGDGYPGCKLTTSNTIVLQWTIIGGDNTYLVSTGVHEAGHVIGYQAGLRRGYSDDYAQHDWVEKVNGWSRIDGEWIYNGPLNNLVSNKAWQSPLEDFAETWAFLVDQSEHYYPSSYYGVWWWLPPNVTNAERLEALNDALYGR